MYRSRTGSESQRSSDTQVSRACATARFRPGAPGSRLQSASHVPEGCRGHGRCLPVPSLRPSQVVHEASHTSLRQMYWRCPAFKAKHSDLAGQAKGLGGQYWLAVGAGQASSRLSEVVDTVVFRSCLFSSLRPGCSSGASARARPPSRCAPHPARRAARSRARCHGCGADRPAAALKSTLEVWGIPSQQTDGLEHTALLLLRSSSHRIRPQCCLHARSPKGVIMYTARKVDLTDPKGCTKDREIGPGL